MVCLADVESKGWQANIVKADLPEYVRPIRATEIIRIESWHDDETNCLRTFMYFRDMTRSEVPEEFMRHFFPVPGDYLVVTDNGRITTMMADEFENDYRKR